MTAIKHFFPLTGSQKRRLRERKAAVRAANAELDAATTAQKRVLIAKDVIKQLDAAKFLAKAGVYAVGSFMDTAYVATSAVLQANAYNRELPAVKAVLETDARDFLLEAEVAGQGVSCNVCALGGLFMSCMNLRNTVTLGDLTTSHQSQHRMRHYLGDIFENEQLALIETAFECSVFAPHFDSDDDEDDNEALAEEWGESDAAQAAIAFGNKFPKAEYRSCDCGCGDNKENDEPRLRAIMQNIIDNGGTFKP